MAAAGCAAHGAVGSPLLPNDLRAYLSQRGRVEVQSVQMYMWHMLTGDASAVTPHNYQALLPPLCKPRKASEAARCWSKGRQVH